MTMTSTSNARATGRARIGRAVRIAGLIALGTAAVLVLRGRLDLRGVLPAVRRADPAWLTLAVVAQLASIEMFARQQRSLLHAFGVYLSAGRSRAITFARIAISVVMPAGSVVSAGFAFTQWRARGATRGTAAAVMVLSGIASFVGLAGLYLIGSGVAVAIRAGAGVPPVLAAGAGFALLLGALARGRRRARRRARPTPSAQIRPVPAEPSEPAARPWSVHGLRSSAVQTWRSATAMPRRYAATALAFAAANWLTDLVCLAVTARALHLRLGLVPVAGVYLAVQIVRQVPLTPGGVGLIETSLLAGLVAAGAGNADASAVVLIYRLLSCWLIVPVGAATWAALHHPGRQTPGRSLGEQPRQPGVHGEPGDAHDVVVVPQRRRALVHRVVANQSSVLSHTSLRNTSARRPAPSPRCAGRDPDPEADQLALDAPVAPGRVLLSQAKHQHPHVRVDGRPTRSGVRVRPVPGEQLPVPAQQRRRGDEEDRPARTG
jgi:uncharacterized membrane protein YbhN (UPF0104 family)